MPGVVNKHGGKENSGNSSQLFSAYPWQADRTCPMANNSGKGVRETHLNRRKNGTELTSRTSL